MTCDTVHLTARRKRCGLTQSECAELVGLRRASTLSRLESGRREPDLRTLIAYEIAFGSPVRELVPDLYAHIEAGVCSRAGVLCARLRRTPKPRAEMTLTILTRIAARGPNVPSGA